MFDRFSEKARRVIFFARYETSQFGSPAIDTEHLLLGILREAPDSITSVAGADAVEAIREEVRENCPVRDKIAVSADLPFSEAAMRVLESAVEEANQQSGDTITAEHILIGLLWEKNCLAHEILAKQGVTLESICNHTERGEKAAENIFDARITGKAVPTKEFRKVVFDAIDEASLLGSISAKPEHLLLGLLRDETSLAARIFRDAGLDYDAVRERVKEG
jgi:ATP-dependent Clp protease ATP-binding subunit ClpA